MKISSFQNSIRFSLILIGLVCASDSFAQNTSGFDGSTLSLSKKSDGARPKIPVQSRDWFYTALEVNYVMLNLLDLVTTFRSIDNGAVELNPIARTFIKKKPFAILVKGAATGGVLFALSRAKRKDKKAAYVVLGVLNLMYGFVVYNNFGVYLEMRK